MKANFFFQPIRQLSFLFRRIIAWTLRFVVPEDLLARTKFELIMYWRCFVYELTPKQNFPGDAFVNLGCGGGGRPGWINIDGARGYGIDIVYDLRKRIPLPDGIATGIFCEHFLEHLEYAREVPHFLSECFRVLRPGGVIRIVVPDAGKYLLAYSEGSWESLSKIRPLLEQRTDYWYKMKYRSRMELINMVFRQGGEHKFAYDWETLDMLLREQLFSTVTHESFGIGSMEKLCLDRPERASESIYVEAHKPRLGIALAPRG